MSPKDDKTTEIEYKHTLNKENEVPPKRIMPEIQPQSELKIEYTQKLETAPLIDQK